MKLHIKTERIAGLLILSGFLLSCQEPKLYQKQIAKNEKESLAQSLLDGVVYYYQGTVPEQFLVEEALSFDSTNADIWRELGTAQVKRGFARNMEYFYGEAVKRDPENWQGWRGYLYLYFYRDYKRAIEDFNLVDSLTETVAYSQGQSHDYMRGIAYYGLADYENALYYLDKYIDQITQEQGFEWADVYSVLYRGIIYMKLGKNAKALDNFESALEIYPTLADAYFHIACIQYESNNYKDAKESLKLAEEYFGYGYYHNRPYVEVLDQIYASDFAKLEELIREAL